MGPSDQPSPQTGLTLREVRQLPKLLLHDHLDGGLRPATLVELARAVGHKGLPTHDPGELAAWFVAEAARGDLGSYLECFAHTVAVMQTAEALERVAAEAVGDLAEDGVIYAEVRFAPQRHTSQLSLGQAVEAVLAGLAAGTRQARACGPKISVRLVLCAMRDGAPAGSLEVVKTALAYRRRGVVGFDLAGPEEGYPAAHHWEAFKLAGEEGLPITVHAGEAAGPASVAEALHTCRASRIGHGARIAEQVGMAGELSVPVAGQVAGRQAARQSESRPSGRERGAQAPGPVHLGPVAGEVLRRRVPLEICPTSNVQTGAAPTLAKHPAGLLYELGFCVTINTDNRLMSGVSLSSELFQCARAFGWGWPDLHRLALNAAESAFCGSAGRRRLAAIVGAAYRARACYQEACWQQPWRG